MRTVHCSCARGMYPSMHWAGECLPKGVSAWGLSAQGVVCPGRLSSWGCLPRGVSVRGVCWGDVWPGGCLARGMSGQRVYIQGVSARHLCEQNDWQTPSHQGHPREFFPENILAISHKIQCIRNPCKHTNNLSNCIFCFFNPVSIDYDYKDF